MILSNILFTYIKVYKVLKSIYLKELKMVKKCIYCRSQISEDSVVDFCQKCGYGVWGEKMYNAIVAEMKAADQRGDLDQGGNSNPLRKVA